MCVSVSVCTGQGCSQSRRARLLTLVFLPFQNLFLGVRVLLLTTCALLTIVSLASLGLGLRSLCRHGLQAPVSCQGGAGGRAWLIQGHAPGLQLLPRAGLRLPRSGDCAASASWVLSSDSLFFSTLIPRPPVSALALCPAPLPLSPFPSPLSFLFLISSSGKLTLPHPFFSPPENWFSH